MDKQKRVGSRMKIIVCPDSFKGTMTAVEAAEAMRQGVLDAAGRAEGAQVVSVPIGDGGEGTVAALAAVLQDTKAVVCETVDAIGRSLKASYAIVGNTALIESAAASGLTLISPSERDILRASTYGTGLLIADAVGKGIRDFIVCMGGTATCDGGLGALEALESLPAHTLDSLRFTLLCDVDNPLCGPRGAAAVFGPQKGASDSDVALLDSRLRSLVSRGLNVDAPYAGAAGGLAGMLMARFGAVPVSGIAKVLEMLDFPSLLKDADLVVTGEGKADATTLSGKAPMGVLEVARRFGVPVALVCGKIEGADRLMAAGFRHVVQATPSAPDPAVAPAVYLRGAVREMLCNITHF